MALPPEPHVDPLAPGRAEVGERARVALAAQLTRLSGPARRALGDRDADAFLARIEHGFGDLYGPLDGLFGPGRADDTPAPPMALDALLDALLDTVLAATAARPDELRALDHRREIDPGWFQRADMVGYVTYVDRFADTLAGLGEHLDLLEELGVTYLHLMPLLRPRPGESDGGYAVADYDEVDPALGSMDELEALAGELRRRHVSLCVDLVVNHTAAEHEWARRAVAGDPRYRAFYRIFPDREIPDRYEETLPEVFPDFAPGNFTEVPGVGWVWTTFNTFQWDLDHANPDVFRAMLDVMLHLANRGVEILRLDAVPFTWKRLGTDCQNQPEAHLLLQAWRALVRMAAPAVVFKAEAIVPPDQLVPYLGAHARFRRECDLAYHNQLMVQLWSSLAARDGRVATHALRRLRPAPEPTSWVTYVRGHDDIGWAIDDADAMAAGWGGASHRRFLVDYYAGDFPGSFATGARFQENPATGDARTSGTAAALCGIEQGRAAGDAALVDAGIRRLVLLYSVIFSWSGIPLVYMGDEIALGDDGSWRDDPARAGDNRWMHRPRMDWTAAARRHQAGTVEQRVFDAMAALSAARRRLDGLRRGAHLEVLDVDDPHVLAYARHHPSTGSFLALVNFGDEPARIHAGLLDAVGLVAPTAVCGSETGLTVVDDHIVLAALGYLWLADA
ncbi:MAG TPA: alpha-amylase family protein [Acidimicrobiales bacterium]|nr:alpha-amylase family protein [Acidimicrobiales bacterium]